MAEEKWTQVSLSKATGVHQSQISRFRRGKFTRPDENLRKVCAYAGVLWSEPLTMVGSDDLHALVDAIITELKPAKRHALFALLKALRTLTKGESLKC